MISNGSFILKFKFSLFFWACLIIRVWADIILLKAFASAVVGGFGSLPGAIVGGFTVGLFETSCAFFISGSHKDAYAFLLMIVVLLIKPTGFFGVQVKMKA